MPTISQISTVLGADAAEYGALRKAAVAGALGRGVVIDGRGTQTFSPYAMFSAALLLALARADVHGTDAIDLVNEAEPELFSAVESVIAGAPVHFRVATWANGTRLATFAKAGDPLPNDAESVLVIFAPSVWARPIAMLREVV